MKNKNDTSEITILRHKAISLLGRRPFKFGLEIPVDQTRILIDQLEAKKIELESQIRELLEALAIAESTSDKYIDLYNFAQTGYITLSKEGDIIELNLYAANILGKERLYIKNSRFGFYVSKENKHSFKVFLKKVFESKVKESCEMTLLTYNSSTIDVYIKGIASKDGQECFLNIFDFTEQKKAEDLARTNKEIAFQYTKKVNRYQTLLRQ